MSPLQGPIFTTLWCTPRFVREASMSHTPPAIPWHSVNGRSLWPLEKVRLSHSFTNSSSWFSGLFSEGTDRPASTIGWGFNGLTTSPSGSWNPYSTSSAVQGLIPSFTGDWTAVRPLAPADDPDVPLSVCRPHHVQPRRQRWARWLSCL